MSLTSSLYHYGRQQVILILSMLLSLTTYAQLSPRQGAVRDARTGETLPGVNITIKGTTRGTVTDVEGRFTIQAQKGDVLVVSLISMSTQEVSVGDQASLDIRMSESAKSLDEVVVVGYGQQSRRTLTGSVATVDPTVFKSAPRTNVATALQGTVPGLRVQQTTGQPGATPNISFRGGTDFSGAGAPLIVVDGVIVPSLFGINMEDVESMDLLKDAASTAIYGARASNGVILVSTRKGKNGRTQVTYSVKRANNYLRRNPLELMSAEDYIRWNRRGLGARFEAARADNNTAEMNNIRNQLAGAWGWGTNSGWTAPDGRYSTQLVSNANRGLLNDPQYRLLVDKNPFNPTQVDSLIFRSIGQRELEDLILQRSNLTEHYLNVSGGNEQGNFALGVGSMNDVGILIGSAFKRLNLNFNGGLNVGKNLTVSLNLAGYNTQSTPSYLTADGGGGVNGGVIQRFGAIAPTVRLTHDVTGAILPGVDGSTLGNPLYFRDKFINNTTEQRYSGGLNIEYRILPGLKLLGSATGFYRYTTNDQFTKAFIAGTGGAFVNSRNASFSNQRVGQYQYNGFLQYDKTIDKHTVSILGGGEFYELRQYDYGASASLAATDFIPWLSASTNAVGVPSSSFSSWQRLASGIGRVNYSYDNRYLLTLNARYDGTSRLTNNRYGFFPGVSAGWNVHFEDFFAKSDLNRYVSTLKPRISWGVNGSIAPLGDYATIPQYGTIGIYNGQPGFAAGSIANPNLRWERASTLNFGLDLGLLNNRVTVLTDYFIRNVYDKLATLPIPGWTGYSSYLTNNGQLQNRGVELEVRANILKPDQAGGLSWTVGANFFHVKNYAVKLPDNGLDLNRQNATQVYDPAQGKVVWVGGLQEGKRIGLDEVYAPVYDGIYTSQSEIDARANFVNTYLPYTNKRIKLPGDARWRDLDQNDTLDFRDFVFVGRTTPTVQGGFSSTLQWKGFTLFGQFDYALGFVIVNQMYMRGMSQVQGSQNGPTDVTRTWSPDTPNETLPRYYWANYGRNYFLDAGGGTTAPANFWQKGNYLAMREITLSYDTSPAMMSRLTRDRVKSVRVFLTGSNLAYFTRYNGTLPDTGGNDVGRFPLPRVVTLGATITL